MYIIGGNIGVGIDGMDDVDDDDVVRNVCGRGVITQGAQTPFLCSINAT